MRLAANGGLHCAGIGIARHHAEQELARLRKKAEAPPDRFSDWTATSKI
jgi:hypothetical protein